MTEKLAACEAVLARYERASISPEIAAMEMLIAAEDATFVMGLARDVAAQSPRMRKLAELLERHSEGCTRVAAMLRSGVDSPPKNGTIEEGVAFCRKLFDWSVNESEEASVALYSLGSPDVLREATREITALFASWHILGADRVALDIGCGIGRLEVALSAYVRRILAIDVSPAMIAAAQRRCDGLTNVMFAECTGMDLEPLRDASFDLVLAVDSFPYLVQSGMPLVETHFREVARVLRPGGDFVILNFAYRDMPPAEARACDAEDVRRLALENDLEPIVAGATPFKLWNGAAFHMKKN